MSEHAYNIGEEAWPRAAATTRARERITFRYAPSDIPALLWRRWPLMLAVFLVVAALGLFVALRMKETFQAHSNLLIQLGQEYVYQPAVGDTAKGATPTNDQVVGSELEFLQSQIVKERTVDDIGIARMSPELGRAYARAGEEKRKDIKGAAIKMIDTGLKVESAPDSPTVKLKFTARDPELAALVLNTLVDEYLRYRRTVMIDGEAGQIQARLTDFQNRLGGVDGTYQKFLADNGVASGDFDAEKAALTANYAQLTTEAYSVQASLSEAEGRLGVTSRNAAQAQPEIGLYRDLDHQPQDELNKLKVQRQTLLSKYLPTAQPVRDLDLQISAAEALVARGPQDGGARRLGPNPIYQSLVTEKNQLEAQAASYRDRLASVRAALAEVAAQRMKLTGLEPQYLSLSRQRGRPDQQRQDPDPAGRGTAGGAGHGQERAGQYSRGRARLSRHHRHVAEEAGDDPGHPVRRFRRALRRPALRLHRQGVSDARSGGAHAQSAGAGRCAGAGGVTQCKA